MHFVNEGKEVKIDERTLERQCDHEYLDEIRDIVDQYDAIVSLACGVGVQFAAEKYQSTPLLPGPKSVACGQRGARHAESACWPVPAGFVRFPDVPSGY